MKSKFGLQKLGFDVDFDVVCDGPKRQSFETSVSFDLRYDC